MVIYRWKHPTIKSHLLGLLQGFAEIADGVATLLTLAFFAPDTWRKNLQNGMPRIDDTVCILAGRPFFESIVE